MEIDIGKYGKLELIEDLSSDSFKFSGDADVNTKFSTNFEVLVFTNDCSTRFIEYVQSTFHQLENLMAVSNEELNGDQYSIFEEYINDWVEFLENEDNFQEFVPEMNPEEENVEQHLRDKIRLSQGIISTNEGGEFRFNLDFLLGDHPVFLDNLLTAVFDEKLHFLEMHTDG